MDSLYESILLSIKRLLGIAEDDYSFDPDIIMNINTAFMNLNQMGAGPKQGFKITSAVEKWCEFIGNSIRLEGIKTYVYLKTRLVFDPPSNSFAVEAIKDNLKELEVRIKMEAEGMFDKGGTVNGD